MIASKQLTPYYLLNHHSQRYPQLLDDLTRTRTHAAYSEDREPDTPSHPDEYWMMTHLYFTAKKNTEPLTVHSRILYYQSETCVGDEFLEKRNTTLHWAIPQMDGNGKLLDLCQLPLSLPASPGITTPNTEQVRRAGPTDQCCCFHSTRRLHHAW